MQFMCMPNRIPQFLGAGPGDKLEMLDRDIIMRTCDESGRLLMPDVPVKATPIQVLNMAFSGVSTILASITRV